MRGWLVVNSFLDSAKFDEIYDLLLAAARKHGIALSLVRGDELCGVVGEGFRERELPAFAIFWDKDIMLARELENA
ncbi:MAG: RimK family alpha-L-glutamate ligase, partial [Oscillospiraceae bacterium]|nr:RimK family alpha-L-glutamate ligase [Oscillospiraceae bacterium]